MAALVGVPGASAVVEGGAVVYSNSAKVRLAGVSAAVIDKFGSISHETAAELAQGAARITNADIGVGITGYADGERGGEIIFGFYFGKKVLLSDENIRVQDERVFVHAKNFRMHGGRSIGRGHVIKTAVNFAINELIRILKFKVGALAGKFLPPQIGHAKLILDAAELSETLYVVLAERPEKSAELCNASGIPAMDAVLRLEWMKTFFAHKKHIKFLYMDESGIPPMPHGTREWSAQFKKLIPEKIDAKFFGEEAYFDMNEKYFPESAAVLIKRGIDSPEISASQIRSSPCDNLDYLIPPARGFFENYCKKEVKR